MENVWQTGAVPSANGQPNRRKSIEAATVVKKMVIKSVPPIMMIYISEWRQYRARLVKLDEETYFILVVGDFH